MPRHVIYGCLVTEGSHLVGLCRRRNSVIFRHLSLTKKRSTVEGTCSCQLLYEPLSFVSPDSRCYQQIYVNPFFSPSRPLGERDTRKLVRRNSICVSCFQFFFTMCTNLKLCKPSKLWLDRIEEFQHEEIWKWRHHRGYSTEESTTVLEAKKRIFSSILPAIWAARRVFRFLYSQHRTWTNTRLQNPLLAQKRPNFISKVNQKTGLHFMNTAPDVLSRLFSGWWPWVGRSTTPQRIVLY